MLRGAKWQACRAGALLMVFAAASCVGKQWTPKESKSDSAMGLSSIEGPQEGAVDYDQGEPGTKCKLALDLEQRYQTLDGFGAALAWYQERIAGNTVEGLYETLFPELGLDILRFRNRYQRSEKNDNNLNVEVEIFERATKALGYPPKLLLSSWSPPSKLKANGAERCKSNDDCTLVKKRGKFVYDEFTDYWTKSLKHYRSLGLAPTYVSIQNEPDFIPPDWEGCKFEPTETAKYPGYDVALKKVHTAFQKLDDPPQLIGPEMLGIHYNRVPSYLKYVDTSLLSAVAHHIYEMGNDGVWDWRDPGPDSFLDEMRDVAALTAKPLWQSEFATDDDKGIDGGFETAWLVHHSLAEEGVSAFIYWDLIWDGTRGLVGMLGRRPLVRDQYFSMRHFARFTDPGYLRVHTATDHDTLLASAYIAPDNDTLTIVVLNTGSELLEVDVDPGGFAATKSETYRTTYRPGESDRWRALEGAGNQAPLRLPGRSVATVVLYR